MKCNNCSNEATVSVLTTVNGQSTKKYLCEDCAQRIEESNAFMIHNGLNFDNIFSSVFSDKYKTENAKRCEECGTTLSEIAKSGTAGCAGCYSAFRQELLPTINKIHGTTLHKGKLAFGADVKLKQKRQITQLEQNLAKSIEAQEFEQAAVLRDEIKALKKEGDLCG